MKKLIVISLASGLVVLTLSACGGQGEVAEPVTFEEVKYQQSTEIDSDYFDVNAVNNVSMDEVNVTIEDYMPANHIKLAEIRGVFQDIITRYNVSGISQIGDMDPVVSQGLECLALNIQERNEQNNSARLLDDYRDSVRASYAMFAIGSGEEGLGIIKDLIIESEAQGVFDQVVIQVIRDAEEHGPSNIYRLLIKC